MIFKLQDKIKKEYFSAWGLVFSEIFVFIVASKIFHFLFQSRPAVGIWITIIAMLITACIWFFKRSLPLFKENEIGIIVAFNSIQTNQKYVKKLKEVISLQLKEELKYIKYKVLILPPNHQIFNEQEASKIRQKTKAHLIIWGVVSVGRDGDKGKAIYLQKKTFFLTFKLRTTTHKEFFQDTSVLFQPEATVYHEDNECVELQNMQDNITRVSKFALAKCLAIDYKFQDALFIFEQLQHEDIHDAQIKRILQANINFILYNKIIFDYNTKIYLEGTFHVDEMILKQTLKDANSIDIFVPNIYLLQASLYALLRQFNKAEKVLNVLKKQRTRNNSVNISMAFISLWRGNLHEAQKYFWKTNFQSLEIHNINHILDFYDYFIEQYPEKFCFLYGYAYINLRCKDQKLAKLYFQKFIANKNNTSVHWKDQARQLLTQCNTTTEENAHV